MSNVGTEVCPMCGELLSPLARQCPACGERLVEELNPQWQKDAQKVGELRRALAAMYFAVAIGLAFAAFEVARWSQSANDALWIAVLVISGMGSFAVGIGVAGDRDGAIRFGMIFSGVVAAMCLVSCFLSPVCLLLVPGILQSRRILLIKGRIELERESL